MDFETLAKNLAQAASDNAKATQDIAGGIVEGVGAMKDAGTAIGALLAQIAANQKAPTAEQLQAAADLVAGIQSNAANIESTVGTLHSGSVDLETQAQAVLNPAVPAPAPVPAPSTPPPPPTGV